ncbi:MAG: hypothetical protein AAGU19_16650 [Prolixibacteraceae bacterium]
MEKKNAVNSLRETIRLLEIKQAEEGRILKEQFLIGYEQLKPVNLIRSTVRGLLDSPEVKTGLLGTFVSLVSGYITRKMDRRPEKNSMMKTIRMILQFGIAGLVSGNLDTIRSFVNRQFSRITSLR